MIGTIVNGITGVASSFIDANKEKALQKSRIQEAKVNAQIKRIEKSIDSESNYDLEALRQTQYSYKDELALLVILAPFVGSFLPWTQEYVAKGWEHASMGIRWAVSGFFGKK